MTVPEMSKRLRTAAIIRNREAFSLLPPRASQAELADVWKGISPTDVALRQILTNS